MALFVAKLFICISAVVLVSVHLVIPGQEGSSELKRTGAKIPVGNRNGLNARRKYGEKEPNPNKDFSGLNTGDLPVSTKLGSDLFSSKSITSDPNRASRVRLKTKNSNLPVLSNIDLPKETKVPPQTEDTVVKAKPSEESELAHAFHSQKIFRSKSLQLAKTLRNQMFKQLFGADVSNHGGLHRTERKRSTGKRSVTSISEIPGKTLLVSQQDQKMLPSTRIFPSNPSFMWAVRSRTRRRLKRTLTTNIIERPPIFPRTDNGKPIESDSAPKDEPENLHSDSQEVMNDSTNLLEQQLPTGSRSQRPKQMRLLRTRLSKDGELADTNSYAATDESKIQSYDVNTETTTTNRIQAFVWTNSNQQKYQHNQIKQSCTDRICCCHIINRLHQLLHGDRKLRQNEFETSVNKLPSLIQKEEGERHLRSQRLKRNHPFEIANDSKLSSKNFASKRLHEHSNDNSKQKQLWHYQIYSESNCSDVCQTNSPFPKMTSPLLISHCSLNITGQYLNCSHRNLPCVPDNPCPVVCALDKIRTYNLHSNNISSIQNCNFSRFKLLEYLDLSSNQLTSLEPRAFYGLKKLKSLNLWGNNLTMDKNYPPCIFSDLKSLTKLQINRNDPNIKNGALDYPDQALSHLSKLTDLSMDGQYAKEFGPGFKKLRLLTNLTLEGYQTGYCNIGILTNTTFQNVPYIKDLNIANCFISKVDPFAFSPLRKLVFLNLKHNEDIGIKQLPNVFQGLQNITTLRHLNMKLVVNRYSIGICLDHQYLNFFPQHLESLNVQENNIEGIDRLVIRRLSPTLKSLDVSGNKFVFGTYLKDLHLMENLTHLKFNGGSFTYRLPTRFPYQLLSPRNGDSNCTLYSSQAMRKNMTFELRLPPRLHTIEMNNATLTYILSALQVNESNNLTILSLKGNTFPKLIGPFSGLHGLKNLTVSSCQVAEVKSSFFSNLSSLEILDLSFNRLGDFFSATVEPDLFSSLTNLKSLDLAYNDISVLPKNIFINLNKLKVLLLYYNPLERFDIMIRHITNLRELDLDNTRISSLDKTRREHIDNLIADGQNVTVRLERCPIMCDCQNLVFLEWMKKSKSVNLSIPYMYRCTYPDMSTKTIKDGYEETIQILEQQCRPQEILMFFVGAGTCVMIIIIVVAILYRFRWKLRYLYYAAHLFYRGKSPTDEEREYEYDAFICYDSEDEHFVVSKFSPELEKRGLKLCIHSRDFIAGQFIASNIVKAVCASRRTVVVLTRNFIQSYWCSYELQMANMESVHTGRPVLIFLLMEKIPESDLSVEILYNIRNNTYIPYPRQLPDATSMGRLWDKLASDIKA